jgi:hypothetical protein
VVIFKQRVKVTKDGKITVNVPSGVPLDQSIDVIIAINEHGRKRRDDVANLKDAMSDPLFLADLKEIDEDFKYIDAEDIL